MVEQPLEYELGQLLAESGAWLATAESCTGGLLSHRITNVPGSSAYFRGGVVAYANLAKSELLGVKSETLEHHGAVSQETVLEMGRGVCRLMAADIGVAISGIAGPGGGTAEKPVGLVWIALAAGNYEKAQRYLFGGDRLAVKEQSADAALRMLVDSLRSSFKRAETNLHST